MIRAALPRRGTHHVTARIAIAAGAAAAAVLVAGCSGSSTAAVGAPATSSSGPPSAGSTSSAVPGTTAPTRASATASPSREATPSPSAARSATLPPPPVVDLCADFDKTLPTLRETRAPGGATTRGQVAALQRGLKRLGFDPGPADGWFGPRTTAAVLAFQRDNALPADGVVGARTWNVWFIDACGID